MMRHRGGLRLIDLLVILILLLVVFLGFVTPTLTRIRDYGWNEKCSDTLRNIGQAMFMYANSNHGQFPRTRWDANSIAVNSYTNPYATDPFATNGPLPNDVTASLFLLARTQGLPPETFLCPLTSLEVASSTRANWATRSNFSGPNELGYSMANPFPSPQAVKSGFHWDDKLTAEDPLLADMNPGTAALSVNPSSTAGEMTKGNTRNHRGGVGQVILFGDGHTDVQENPFAGVGGDNIFTYGPTTPTSGGTGVIGFPTSADDAVLLPVATIDPGALLDPWTRDRYSHFAMYAILFGIIAGIVSCASILIGRTAWARRKHT